MTRRTAFFFDELCLWHAAGPHALTLPVGGWVQPPAAAGHAESPENQAPAEKPARRVRPDPPACNCAAHRRRATEDLAARASGALSGTLQGVERRRRRQPRPGRADRPGQLRDRPGSPPAWPSPRWTWCSPARRTTPTRCRGRQVTTACRTRRWASVSSPTSPWPSRRPRRATAVERVAVLDWDVHHGKRHPGDLLPARRRVEHFPASGRLLPAWLQRRRRHRRGSAVVASTSTCRCFPAAVTTPTCRPCNASCCQRWSASARN
ncbi:acetylpolyamine aminohydrolase [Pseudomonas aeruginosa]|nr:acetylpolyamine aminohydrolase [Pseudomonas aeruginosa]